MSPHCNNNLARFRISLRQLFLCVAAICVVASIAGNRIQYANQQRDAVQSLVHRYPTFMWDSDISEHGNRNAWWEIREVRYVVFAQEPPVPADIARLRNFKGLKSLGFTGFMLTREQIASIPAMPQVESLMLAGSDVQSDQPNWEVGELGVLCDKFPSLVRLEVKNMRLTRETTKGLSRYRQLRELLISNVTCDDSLVQEISTIPCLSDLSIDLSGVPTTLQLVRDCDVQTLSVLAGLRRLTLRSRSLSANCIPFVRKMSSLEECELWYGDQPLSASERDEIARQVPGVRITVGPVDFYGNPRE